MSQFVVTPTPLKGVSVVERKAFQDSRGFFSRFFCIDQLQAAGWRGAISQVNHSLTVKKGAVRGLHFQYPPHAEQKYISCVKGAIFDVAVDIRRDSPTLLQWFGIELSAENKKSLLVPEGFAHGFQAVTDNAEIIYCVSTPYAPDAEDGLSPVDEAIRIEWPEVISEMSDRDKAHPNIDANFKGVLL